MSFNYKLTIEYDGTHFKGWQVQKKGERTVQAEIEKALKKIFNEPVKLTGSGRTDSGVHARGQVANFKSGKLKNPDLLTKALNAILPKDIAITNTRIVKEDFHAQYSVQRKTYRYTILNRQAPNAIGKNFCLHVPYPLNLSRMRNEAKSLMGKHDFRSFQGTNKSNLHNDNTTRTIKRLTISQKNDYIYITIVGDGFLYKMVRNIVGTLIEIGRKPHPKGTIKDILIKKNRHFAGSTAKAHGLCLLSVIY